MSEIEKKEQQLSVFDYTILDNDTAKLAKESAIEIKAREKAIWENIIEIGNKLIEVKKVLPHGQFETWLKIEFGWDKSTSSRYMKIAEEIKPNVAYRQLLPNSRNSLYALASGLANSDKESKQEILEEVKTKSIEKGKPLTEKEINNLPQIIELKAKLKAEKEAKELAENNQSSLFNQLENKVKEVNKLEETIANQNNQINELNEEIKELDQDLTEYNNFATQLELDREELDERIKNESDKIIKETLEIELGLLAQKEAEINGKQLLIEQLLRDKKANNDYNLVQL